MKKLILLIHALFLQRKSWWYLYCAIQKTKLGSAYDYALKMKLKLKYYGSYIGPTAKFESEPCFPHGIIGVFISGGSTIGKNCVIFQQVTIGSNTLKGSPGYGAPVIGDNCYIGAGAKIIGNVKIGNNCRIGANAVVVKDVPDNTVVVIKEMRYIHHDEVLDNAYITMDADGSLKTFDNGAWN